ncbi:MAG: cytochrome b/b6 domain-containing protein [Pseudomonadota bacterium]
MRLTRRAALKIMHWSMVPLLVWFVALTPADVVPLGLFQLHSALALVFVTISLLWTATHLRKGLASRPGPKLPPAARVFHQLVHKTLIWGLFGVAATGFLLGLTSSTLLKAGGFLPIAPPMGWRQMNEIVGTIHIFEFYLLAAIALAHAAFHLWRHLKLKDNALRIMAPKALHRFL